MRRIHFFSRCALVTGLLLSMPLVRTGQGEERKSNARLAAEKAVQRIEEVGGAVRYLTAGAEELEVDFQFAGEQLGDAQLKYLEALDNVVTLRLKRTAITDKAMVQVGKICTLRQLYLEETAISDRGLQQLLSLQKLEFLNVYSTAVTDKGIEQLASLPRLTDLYVGKTPVTEAGVHALLKAAPQLSVFPNRAEDRRRAEVFLQAARKLLTDVEQQLTEAEQNFKELAPRKDELNKAAEEADKLAEEKKCQTYELGKQREEADKLVEKRQQQAEEASQLARDKPDDEQLKLAVCEKQKVLVEARVRANEAKTAYDESLQQADAARLKSEMAKNLSARAANATEVHEQAKKVLDGARLRLKYAQRGLPPAQ